MDEIIEEKELAELKIWFDYNKLSLNEIETVHGTTFLVIIINGKLS